jgi:hypothetical protein
MKPVVWLGRRVALIIGTFLLLGFAFALAIPAYLLFIKDKSLADADCGPVQEKSVIHSPDGTRDAITTYRGCAGGFGSGSETYWIVMSRPSSGNDRVTVFEADRYQPAVAWADDKHLIITIKRSSDIALSLHWADQVEVKYLLDPSIQPAEKEASTNALEARLRENIRQRKATFTGNAATDPPALDDAIARMRADYARFLKWATENAENFPH